MRIKKKVVEKLTNCVSHITVFFSEAIAALIVSFLMEYVTQLFGPYITGRGICLDDLQGRLRCRDEACSLHVKIRSQTGYTTLPSSSRVVALHGGSFATEEKRTWFLSLEHMELSWWIELPAGIQVAVAACLIHAGE
jgi:hypothetical protein